jgi:hypothetical protein
LYPKFSPNLAKQEQENINLKEYDPSQVDNFLNKFPTTTLEGIITVPLKQANISSITYPYCFFSQANEGNVIIDSEASVCISPHCLDFITYNKSAMKIKDLSLSNEVAGEGIIQWLIKDHRRELVMVELLSYHIPKAEVCLLSPQVLLRTIGGQARQTTTNIEISLDNGIELCAIFCPRSNLPILPLTTKIKGKNKFWDNTFGYTLSNVSDTSSILSQVNTNLSSSQKELLLWHQHLLHALLNLIQILMQDRKCLKDKSNNEVSLHSGPFITAKSQAPICNTSTMKCAACLCAKAHIRSPENLNPCRSNVGMSLKRGHVQLGDCISADHYISLVPGHLPHTFGQEKHGYTCGSLFVDHASGKNFNFCQYSITANKTIKSAQRLESMAKQENIKVKKYHSDNGIFASTAFKNHCESQQQEFSFGGVGAHHQNGDAERNIKTVAQWA